MIEPETLEEKHRSIKAVEIIVAEYLDAISKFDRFNSAHEGYAVLLEEMDELKAEIWKNQNYRAAGALVREAKQVGAMAVRFLVDIALPAEERPIPGKRIKS